MRSSQANILGIMKRGEGKGETGSRKKTAADPSYSRGHSKRGWIDLLVRNSSEYIIKHGTHPVFTGINIIKWG